MRTVQGRARKMLDTQLELTIQGNRLGPGKKYQP